LGDLLHIFRLIPLVALTSLFAAGTSTTPVVDSYAFGGASAILNVGSTSDSTQLGVVVGQGVGGAAVTVPGSATDSAKVLLPGFWIEVASISNTTPIKEKLPATLTSTIGIQFGSGFAHVQFNTTSSVQGSIRMMDAKGRLLGSAWSGMIQTGTSQVDVSLATVAAQPVFLVVQAGKQSRTFHFVPK